LADREYSIRPAMPDDIPEIIALQEDNLPASGGSLSVRQPSAWFERAIAEGALVVARRPQCWAPRSRRRHIYRS
jgi:hypothetical protein